MSVTSSGRSSINSTINFTSGWFLKCSAQCFLKALSFRLRRHNDQTTAVRSQSAQSNQSNASKTPSDSSPNAAALSDKSALSCQTASYECSPLAVAVDLVNVHQRRIPLIPRSPCAHHRQSRRPSGAGTAGFAYLTHTRPLRSTRNYQTE